MAAAMTAAVLGATASAATITVDSLADDVYINASGQTFSDPGFVTPSSPTYCTLRMAITAANRDAAIGGCAAGSGSDSIVFAGAAVSGTITLSQATMSEAPDVFTSTPPNWLLVITRPLTITGPGSGALTISGGGFSAGSLGRRSLLITNNDAAIDAPVTISGLRFKEGRAVASAATGGPSPTIGSSGGCIFSRESVALSDVVFENCEAAGYGDLTLNTGTIGGAFGVGAAAPTDALPAVSLVNVRFLGNRTVHGSANAATTSAAGAAAIGNPGTLWVGPVTISGSRFIGNTAESVGALRITNAASVNIAQTIFVSNSATAGNDGAMSITAISGAVTLSGVGVISNSASGARGGVGIFTVGTGLGPVPTAVTITDSSFASNVAYGADTGGLGIITDNFTSSAPGAPCAFTNLRGIVINGGYFENNSAATARGGLRIACSGNVDITDSDINGNEAGMLGLDGSNAAGEISFASNITITNTSISRNRANKGSGGTGGNGILQITGAGFNVASMPQVAYPLTHSFTGRRLIVKDNRAEGNNGGLTLRPGGAGRSYVIEESSFVSNTAGANVALMLNATGNYSIRNNTFSLNETNATGGSIIAVNAHAQTGTNNVTFASNTVARNYVGNVSHVVVNSFYTGIPNELVAGAVTPNISMQVANTIMAMTLPGAGGTPFGLTTGSGYNYSFFNSVLESSTGLPGGFCSAPGMKCNLDPKLDQLQFRGGGPVYVHALQPGSPALDAGDNSLLTGLTTDQRGSGFPRIVNGTVDIGAFESAVLTAALPCKLDMDGDNQVVATKEGLVILRAMLGLSEATAVVGTGISQPQWNATRINLNTNCGTNFAP